MLHLEQAITAWRNQMLAAGMKSPVPLDELEIHLREAIEQRMHTGISAQSAFDAAVQQIGHAPLVQGEFEKVEAARDARKWKLQQFAFATSATLFPLWMGCMVFFKIGGFSQATAGERMSSLAAVAVFSLLFWGGRMSHGLLPVIPSKRIRDAVLYAGFTLVVLWWTVFLHVIVPRYDFTAGQFGVVFLWGFIPPAGAFAGLVWGIETAARKPGRHRSGVAVP